MYTITLLQQKYKVSGFDYRTLWLLAKKWNIEKVNDVDNKLVEIFAKLEQNADDLTFKDLDAIGEVIIATVEANNADVELNPVDVVNEMMKDESIMQTFAEIFADSVKRVEAKKKQVPGTRKPRRKK